MIKIKKAQQHSYPREAAAFGGEGVFFGFHKLCISDLTLEHFRPRVCLFGKPFLTM
jgi:hypothetical protein